ncbi:MAG: Zn-dependent hydrolase [Rhodospirillaceae bacterium]|jgi:beta-ureidopropionase / N-carbamoyl-L-amino-acid hydrolase|nr:Zn-dependent hydrolase [Rhodospirillaceae bacterium]
MPKIDGLRLLDDLKTLRAYGASGNGVVRTSLTGIDVESRAWLLDRMQQAGLKAEIDGIGNVIGRSPNPGPALLMGSHTDTQPEGGWLDGAMGVIYGLEVARALSEDPDTADLAVDVASWMDEEGTFGICMGSRSFLGQVSDDEIARAKDVNGRGMAESLAAAGYAGRARNRLDPKRNPGYLEAHIEQGGLLENSGKRIGVVTAIVGIRTFRLTFEGAQNHAGTTPMPIRKDAGMALIRLAYRIDETFEAIKGERTVWTMGRIALHPGSHSIVPGFADMFLQFRDPDDARMDRFEMAFRALVEEANAAGPVAISVEPKGEKITPTPMDDSLQAHIAAAAEQDAPGDWIHMPSGAGHDAMIIGDEIPVSMLFVPSIDGISHDFAEDTAEDDIVLGCQVCADAVARIVRGWKGKG